LYIDENQNTEQRRKSMTTGGRLQIHRGQTSAALPYGYSQKEYKYITVVERGWGRI
jgi:hypothetical protein